MDDQPKDNSPKQELYPSTDAPATHPLPLPRWNRKNPFLISDAAKKIIDEARLCDFPCWKVADSFVVLATLGGPLKTRAFGKIPMRYKKSTQTYMLCLPRHMDLLSLLHIPLETQNVTKVELCSLSGSLKTPNIEVVRELELNKESPYLKLQLDFLVCSFAHTYQVYCLLIHAKEDRILLSKGKAVEEGYFFDSASRNKLLML